MLAIRCGIALEDSPFDFGNDWLVLRAEPCTHLDTTTLLAAFDSGNALHIFTSNSAISIFRQLWHTYLKTKINPASELRAMAVGVGSTTDAGVRELQDIGMHIQWTFPNLQALGTRLNGLEWTLEQLEGAELIPSAPLHLWTKINSTSERLLNRFRASRNWSDWQSTTHAIYTLTQTNPPIPKAVDDALKLNTPICFGVKSAEVLEASISLLAKHLGVKSARELPAGVHFCTWERSALRKAQELLLNTRLLPLSEFEKLMITRE